MNNFFTKSVLVLALFSPWVNASESAENCNAENGLEGWAIWCGVDTYLAQQEPTAAGPIESGFEGVVIPDVRTVASGGTYSTLTPLDRMAEFASQNRVATYSGSGDYGSLGSVDNTIEVNFGRATWVGNWGGAVGIGAVGTITGNQITSTKVTASIVPTVRPRGAPAPVPVRTTGTISASFNNNNASLLTGRVDVVKDGNAIVGTFENTTP